MRIGLLFASLCLMSTCLHAKPQRVTIFADDAYPPYSYVENGRAVGIYPEILRAADVLMTEFEVELQPIPWRRGLKLLEAGRIFALLPPYYYPQRRPYIHPYSDPILDEEVVVFCQNAWLSKRKSTEWPRDFYGLTIGMNDGFSLGGQAFWMAVEEKRIEVKYANGNRVNLLKLRGDRIDCYVNDRISILWELTRLKREGIVDTVNFSMAAKISLEQGYIGFTNQNLEQYPYQSQFVAAFNSALAELKSSGQLDKIVGRYIE
ncbi:amino acid ABC transporter substrate-binding protein [Vibrio cholerae]|nr:amino acid ABC transporter substrate-binding protein [Vibrio cholerae]